MSSIQERLQLKRVPLDTWNIREQLCLASAVVRSGDQNWMSVSRALKTVGEPNRPADWYSQKSCAAQYGALLEHVETPKRKKRSSEGAVETPQESILKRLTQERIVEIQKNVAEMTQQYEQIKNEITEARNPSTSEERIRELWTNIEAAKRARERESARRAAWLKEREERRARAERTWRPPAPQTPTAAGGTSPAAAPSSPLLTSLLKSSPVVTTPQHITHPANVVETVSPSAGAPTLSMLLDKGAPTTPSTAGVSVASACTNVTSSRPNVHDNKHAAIEHIKSQLVQIERNLTASGTRAPPPLVQAEPTPALDIDDIEIKAEDVYAFRDVDIHLPPVSHLHKATARQAEKATFKKDDLGIPAPAIEDALPTQMQTEIKEEPMVVDEVLEEALPDDLGTIQDQPTETQEEQSQPQPPTPEVAKEPEVRIAFPEVKFPTPEIKVIQSDEQKVKEEVREPEAQPADEDKQEEITVEEAVVVPPPEPVESVPPVSRSEQPEVEEAVEPVLPPAEDAAAVEEPETNPGDIPLPDDSVTDESPDIVPEPPTTIEIEVPPPEIEKESLQNSVTESESEVTEDGAIENEVTESEVTQSEVTESEVSQSEVTESQVTQSGVMESEVTHSGVPEDEVTQSKVTESRVADAVEDVKKEVDDAEDTVTHEQTVLEETASSPAPVIKPEPEPELEVKEEPVAEMETGAHTETDDDTPMELSREEEKDGKKKKDYSRKKKPDSRTCSGSESAEASAPESPSASDAERQYRQWKKSVMLVYSRLCAHKYASLFLRPISDEEAPGYSIVVRRPMDLTTIRRNIDSGIIRTTAEFQRDVLLMLSNALMYNSSEHSVYTMAKEMHEEALCQLGMLLAAQAHAGLAPAAPAAPPPATALATRKRRRHDSPHATHPRH